LAPLRQVAPERDTAGAEGEAGPGEGAGQRGAVMRLPIPRPLSRRLVRAAGREGEQCEEMTVDGLLRTLGDRSLGWCIVLFAIVNLIPMPLGGTMLTALPLLIVTAQMALGFGELRLPRAVMRREIGRRRFQQVVMRLRPLMRPIERVIRPRHAWVFRGRNERLIGATLFAVAVALFLPFPLSGWLPAISLLVTGVGLVERDGLVTVTGLVVGLISLVLTGAVGFAIAFGVQSLAG
jgi:hypothetical protein